MGLETGLTALPWSPDGGRITSANALKMFPAWQTLQELMDHARECCVFRQLTDAERELLGLPLR